MAPPGFILDERVGAWRSEAYHYRNAVLWLREREIPFADCARHYNPPILAVSKRLELSEAAAKELDVLWFAGKLSASAVIERADLLVKGD